MSLRDHWPIRKFPALRGKQPKEISGSFPAREETYQRFHVDVRQIVLVREIKGFRVHLAGTRVHARPLQVTVLTNRQTRACNTVFIKHRL